MSAEMKWITAMAGEAKHGYVQLSPEVPLWVSFSGETGLVNVQIQRTTDVKAAEAVAQAKADECRVALSPSIVLTARHGTKNERMDYLHSLKILPEDSHVPAGYRKLGRINPEALTDKMVLLVSTIGSIIKIQNQEPKPGDKLDILQPNGIWCGATVKSKDEKNGAMTLHLQYTIDHPNPPILVSDKQRWAPHRSKTLEVVHDDASLNMDTKFWGNTLALPDKIHDDEFLGWLSFVFTQEPRELCSVVGSNFLQQCLSFAIQHWHDDVEAMMLLHLILFKTAQLEQSFGAYGGFGRFMDPIQSKLCDLVWKSAELTSFAKKNTLIQEPTPTNRRPLIHSIKQWQIKSLLLKLDAVSSTFSESTSSGAMSRFPAQVDLWKVFGSTVELISDAEIKEPTTQSNVEKWICENVAPVIAMYHNANSEQQIRMQCEWIYLSRLLSCGQLLRRCKALDDMVTSLKCAPLALVWFKRLWPIIWEALTRPQFLHETALKKAIPLVVIAQQHQCLDAAQEKQLEFIQGKEYVEIKRELQTLFSGSSQGLAGATAAGNMNANAVVATATATASGAAVAAMAVAIPNKPIPTLGAVLPPFQLIKNALNRASPIMAAQSRLLETCLLQMTSTTPQTRIHTITTITHCAGITCQSMPNRRAVLTWFFQHHWRPLLEAKTSEPHEWLAHALMLGCLLKSPIKSTSSDGGSSSGRNANTRQTENDEIVSRMQWFSNLEDCLQQPYPERTMRWTTHVLCAASTLKLCHMVMPLFMRLYLHKPWKSTLELWHEWMPQKSECQQKHIVIFLGELKNKLVASAILDWAGTIQDSDTSGDPELASAIGSAFFDCAQHQTLIQSERRADKKYYPLVRLEGLQLEKLHGLSALWTLAARHTQTVSCYLEFVVAIHFQPLVGTEMLHLAKRFELANDFLVRVWKLTNLDSILCILQRARKELETYKDQGKMTLYLTMVSILENSLVQHTSRHEYQPAWRAWWVESFALPLTWIKELTTPLKAPDTLIGWCDTTPMSWSDETPTPNSRRDKSPTARSWCDKSPSAGSWWNEALALKSRDNHFHMALDVLCASPWNSQNVRTSTSHDAKPHRRWGEKKDLCLIRNGWIGKIVQRLQTIRDVSDSYLEINDLLLDLEMMDETLELQRHLLVTIVATKNWAGLEKLLATWTRWPGGKQMAMTSSDVFFKLSRDKLSETIYKRILQFYKQMLDSSTLGPAWSMLILKHPTPLPIMFYILVNIAIREEKLPCDESLWTQLHSMAATVSQSGEPSKMFKVLALYLETVTGMTDKLKSASFVRHLTIWLQTMMQHLVTLNKTISIREATIARILNAIPIVYPLAGESFRNQVINWLQSLATPRLRKDQLFSLLATKSTVDKPASDHILASEETRLTVIRPQTSAVLGLTTLATMVNATNNSAFKGMINPSIFCYIISTTQQLFMMPQFRRLLAEIEAQTNNTLVKGLHTLFQELQDTRTHDAVNPMPYISTLRDENGRPLNRNEQNDAHSYLTTLIDRLQLLVDGTPFGPRLQNMFSIGCQRTKRGQVCNHAAQSSLPSTSCLVVPIAGHKTLDEALHAYIRPEVLQDPVYCDTCQKRVPMTLINTLDAHKLPEYLLLQPNRTEGSVDSTGKNCARLEFPISELLDLLPYCSSSVESKGLEKYQLKGVVVHSGRLSSGHYFSLIREGKQWYRFDDRAVSSVDASSIPEMVYGGASYNTGFLLFYERTEAKAYQGASAAATFRATSGASAAAVAPTAVAVIETKSLTDLPENGPDLPNKSNLLDNAIPWWYSKDALETLCDIYRQLPFHPGILNAACQTWCENVMTTTSSRKKHMLEWIKTIEQHLTKSTTAEPLLHFLKNASQFLLRIRQRWYLDIEMSEQDRSEVDTAFRSMVKGQVKRWSHHGDVATLFADVVCRDLDPQTSIVFSELGSRHLPWINQWRSVYPLSCETWESKHNYASVLMNRLLMPPLSSIAVGIHLRVHKEEEEEEEATVAPAAAAAVAIAQTGATAAAAQTVGPTAAGAAPTAAKGKLKNWSIAAIRRFMAALSKSRTRLLADTKQESPTAVGTSKRIVLDLASRDDENGWRVLQQVSQFLVHYNETNTSKSIKIASRVLSHVLWNHKSNSLVALKLLANSLETNDYVELWPIEALSLAMLQIQDELFVLRAESILKLWIGYFTANTAFWQNMVVAQMAFLRCAYIVLDRSVIHTNHLGGCASLARELLRWWEKYPRADTSWTSQEAGRTSDSTWFCRKETSYRAQYKSDARHAMSPTEIRRVLLMIKQKIGVAQWKHLVWFT